MTVGLIIALDEIRISVNFQKPWLHFVPLLDDCSYAWLPPLPVSTGTSCGKNKLFIKILCKLMQDQRTLATCTVYGTNEELGIIARTNLTDPDFFGTLFFGT